MLLRVIPAFLVGTFLSLAAVPADAQDADARQLARGHYERGLELAHTKQYEQAIEEL